MLVTDDLAWSRRALAETDNLVAAAQWAVAAAAADLAAQLLFAWHSQRSRNYDDTQLALVRVVVAEPLQISPERRRAAQAVGAFDLPAIDRGRARDLAESILAGDPGARDLAAGVAHCALSLCALLDGKPDLIETHLVQSHDICRALGESGVLEFHAVYYAVGQAANLAFAGRVESALRVAEGCVAFAERIGIRLALMDARLELGIVLVEAGDYGRACRCSSPGPWVQRT